MINEQYLTYLAYYYWLKGEPIPVDLYIEMVGTTVNPECLIKQFEDGYEPIDCNICLDEDCPFRQEGECTYG